VKAPSVAATMRFLWQQRSAVHVMMGTAGVRAVGWGLMFWTPTFLQRTYHMSVGEASAVTQNMHLWGGGIATLVTGWLMARSGMSDARRIVWLLAGGIGIATVASGGWCTTPATSRVAKAMLWIFIPAIYFYIGPGFGLLQQSARSARMRAMFCAMGAVSGRNLGNLVIGTAADRVPGATGSRPITSRNAESLRLAMLCLVPTGLVGDRAPVPRCAGHRQEPGARAELSTLAMHIKTVEGGDDENVFPFRWPSIAVPAAVSLVISVSWRSRQRWHRTRSRSTRSTTKST